MPRRGLANVGSSVLARVPRLRTPAVVAAAPAGVPQPLATVTLPGNERAAASTTTPAPTLAQAPAVPGRGSHRAAKFLFFVPMFVFFAVLFAGGYYALRLRDVFSTLNAVSTPAAVISGDALGGSSDIQIDTGPARAALAVDDEPASDPDAAAPVGVTNEAGNGAASTTETPEAAAGDAPAVSDSGDATDETPVVSGNEASSADDPRDVAATRTPDRDDDTVSNEAPADTDPTVVPDFAPAVLERDATPEIELESEPRRVILSELERIKNGGFEDGDDAWYLEEGATITEAEARTGERSLELWQGAAYVDQGIFFVPGTEYQVSAWGKLSETGSSANLGAVYWDADGNRLTDVEPPTYQFTEPIWKRITFTFAPPEEAAVVKIFIWKPENGARFWADDLSVRSIVPEEALTTNVVAAAEGITTILVMGVDAREGEAIDIGVRPDSLAVVQLNSETGSCRMLSIPRDTRTELPGYGLSKINHALAVGGIAYQQQVVEGLLNLEIDHYVLIDFNGFEDLVDAVGGITVDVPSDFISSDGTQFVAGVQAMDGKLALSYARWRGGPDGDFGRIERQQQILRALVAKATDLNVVWSVNELLPAVERNLRTDLSPSEIMAIGSDFQSRCTAETVSMINLEGSPATYDDPLLQMPLYYIEVDEAEIRGKVAALLEP